MRDAFFEEVMAKNFLKPITNIKAMIQEDFSTERMEARRQLNDAFILLKENNFLYRILWLVKIFFNNEAEIETFQIFYLFQWVEVDLSPAVLQWRKY